MERMTWNLSPKGLAGAAVLLSSVANAGVLTGSGSHVVIPAPNPGAPLAWQSPTIFPIPLTNNYANTWSAPALTPWVGTFFADGPQPSTGNMGTTRYDFTTLPAGGLPAGTFFIFGDVDTGSAGNETFELRAFTAPTGPFSFPTPITTPWLDEAVSVWGTGSGPAGSPAAVNMPGWSWNGNTYIIDGNTVGGGNPNVGFALVSNMPIEILALVKTDTSYGFGLAAPVPAPATAALLGAATLAACRRRR